MTKVKIPRSYADITGALLVVCIGFYLGVTLYVHWTTGLSLYQSSMWWLDSTKDGFRL